MSGSSNFLLKMEWILEDRCSSDGNPESDIKNVPQRAFYLLSFTNKKVTIYEWKKLQTLQICTIKKSRGFKKNLLRQAKALRNNLDIA